MNRSRNPVFALEMIQTCIRNVCARRARLSQSSIRPGDDSDGARLRTRMTTTASQSSIRPGDDSDLTTSNQYPSKKRRNPVFALEMIQTTSNTRLRTVGKWSQSSIRPGDDSDCLRTAKQYRGDFVAIQYSPWR